MSRNHAQTGGATLLLRWIAICVILAGLGSSFAAVRNRQIAMGDQKRTLEKRIEAIQLEIQEVQNQKITALSRDNLVNRLQVYRTDLVSIESSRQVVDYVRASRPLERVAAADVFGGLRQTIGLESH